MFYLCIMKANEVNIRNKRARFDYEITDTYIAGIVLTGTEIKSIRDGKASLVDTYCLVENGEVWVKGMNISEYFYGSYNNHVARRDRKLLLNRKEIQKLQKASEDPGYTIVPMKVFINELLAPAADRNVAVQAILHGADAVYMGGPSHGARKKASNSIDDIREVVSFAHRYRARV